MANVQLTMSQQKDKDGGWGRDILHKSCGHQKKWRISDTLSPRVALMETNVSRYGRYIAVTENRITEQCSQAVGPGRLSVRELFHGSEN